MATTVKVKGSVAPADTFTPTLMDGYTMRRTGTSNVIRVPGRAKPVVVLHPVGSRAGSLRFVVDTEARAIAFDALLSRGAIYTLTDTDRGIVGMDFAVDGEGVTVELDGETRAVWLVTVAAVEV